MSYLEQTTVFQAQLNIEQSILFNHYFQYIYHYAHRFTFLMISLQKSFKPNSR